MAEKKIPDMPQGMPPLSKEDIKKLKEKQLDDDNAFLKKQQLQNNGNQRGPGRGGPGMRGGMIREKPKNMRKTLGRLFSYIGRSKYMVIGLLAMTVLTTVLGLVSPLIQSNAINAIVGKGQVNFPVLYKNLIMLFAVYICSSGVSYLNQRFAAKLSQDTVYTMRRDLFNHMSRLPIKFTDTYQHGDIMSRMTNDVENISNTISSSIASLFSAAITLVGSFVIMLSISWQMTIIAFVTVPLTVFVSVFLSKFMRKLFVKQQRLLGALNGEIEEMVTGYKTVMAYGRESEAKKEFSDISGKFRSTAIKSNIVGGIMGPCMNVIGNIGFLLVAAFGGYFALKGTIRIGDIQAFIQYSKNISRPINEVANQYAAIMTAIAGAERVFEIMDAEIESDDNQQPLDIPSVKGDISFEHIMFSYKQGEPVLKDFNLEVRSGQKIAIVGRTGSGKTTVVNLLTRFYEIDDGSIKLDGKDIRTITRSTLRRAIAIVLQDTVLFSDTIGSNIRYGRLDAADEDLRAAAHTANADLFIDRLPEGYDTVLSESGSNLSAGQRQLLSISRAVLADPKILILDEATSSIDTRTEMQIQEAMLKLMEGRTSLIIAHRLSTIRDADMIIVLDDGHIVEYGNHEQLLEQQGVYRKLYDTQFAGIET